MLSYQNETTVRLAAALRWSLTSLHMLPPARDVIPGVSLANAWALITVAYSGVEQSLKYLISQERQETVREWRCSDDGRELGHSHALIKLFDELDPEAKRVVTDYYKRFQSLHSYIPKPSLRGFLEEVSRGNKGYVLWRYSLVDEGPKGIPKNSPDAMVALWRGLVELIEVRNGRARPVIMPDESLWNLLRSYVPALHHRIEQADHPINACAEMLWEQYRGIYLSEKVKDDLDEWVRKIDECADNDLKLFVSRARGLSEKGGGIRWNTDRSRFEDAPWTLPLIEVGDKPQDAEDIVALDQARARQAILRIVHSSGFSVKERMLNTSQGEKTLRMGGEAKWQCTLEAKKVVSPTESCEIGIWESVGDPKAHLTSSSDCEMSVTSINWQVIEWLTSESESESVSR